MRIKPTRKANPNGAKSSTYKLSVACGKLKIVIMDEENYPVEVLIRNTEGGCEANQEVIGRLVTLLLESNIDVSFIIEQLEKVICLACKTQKVKGKDVYLSCGKAIAWALKTHIEPSTQTISKSSVTVTDTQ